MWGRGWAWALDWIFCLLTGWPDHTNELFPRQSPGMLLGRVFPSNSYQKAPRVDLTFQHWLMSHTGVNKTPTRRFMAFRGAEQTLDYFRNFKWRKRKEGKDTPHLPTPLNHDSVTGGAPAGSQRTSRERMGWECYRRDVPWAAWMWDSPCHSGRGTKPSVLLFLTVWT